ncbi:MAG: prepilin peptidase [Candidatus Wallbacteria bacterium]|nr:prepilin peptidase [Candidatus Wallbacteria bacterium]
MFPDVLQGLQAFADLPALAQLPFVAIFAGLVGSFLNVCIWRIPRGESIVFPRSHCPNCNHVLEVPDLVPVLSYVCLRGRCRHCRTPFSPRYMLVELVLILIWSTALLWFGFSWAFAAVALTGVAAIGGTGIALMTRSLRRSSGGFTFISILLAMTLFAIFIGPFLDVLRTGWMGAVKNREYLIAFNLARERLEELRVMPVRAVRGDWEVYVHGRRLTDNIFLDEFGPLAKLGQNEKHFYENFSDVLTERTQFPESVQEKFARAYKRYYGREYQLYPAAYSGFARVTRVKEITDPSTPGITLQQITVRVTINTKLTKNRTIEVSGILSDRGL